MKQRTPEWFQERRGKVTASNIYNVIGMLKNGERTSLYQKYKAKLIAETLTEYVQEEMCSAVMQWGLDHEDEARNAYEIMTSHNVTQCGFIVHPNIPLAGASPDGLVGEDGLIEIKCPTSETHVSFALTKEIKKEYIAQMQFQMACTGRKWCDFVSYDPRFTGKAQNVAIIIHRVERDDKMIDSIETNVRQFIAEMQADIQRILLTNEQYNGL